MTVHGKWPLEKRQRRQLLQLQKRTTEAQARAEVMAELPGWARLRDKDLLDDKWVTVQAAARVNLMQAPATRFLVTGPLPLSEQRGNPGWGIAGGQFLPDPQQRPCAKFILCDEGIEPEQGFLLAAA